MGLLHHIFAEDRQHASTIGSLVDLTSAVIHLLRHPHGTPNTGNGIDYVASEDHCSQTARNHRNWYSYMLDNEVTSAAKDAQPDPRCEIAQSVAQRTAFRHEGGSDVPKSCQGSYAVTLTPSRRTSSILSKPNAFQTRVRRNASS